MSTRQYGSKSKERINNNVIVSDDNNRRLLFHHPSIYLAPTPLTNNRNPVLLHQTKTSYTRSRSSTAASQDTTKIQHADMSNK